MDNKKIIKISIAAVVLVLLGVLIYKGVILKKASVNTYKINTVDRHLTSSEKGAYKKKIKDDEQIIKDFAGKAIENGQYASAYLDIGKQYYGLGDLAGARDNYKKAAEFQSENLNIWTAVYTTALEQTDYEAAKEAVERALVINKKDADLYQKEAELMEEQLKSPKNDIIAVYNTALTEVGHTERLLVLFARFMQRQQDTAAALRLIEEAQSKSADKTQYNFEIQSLKTQK